jgi:hypothetical protein
MASQRRAPTKRPPRPAAKRTPPPESSEGTDAAESVTSSSGEEETAAAAAAEKTSPKAPAKGAPTPTKTIRSTSATKSGGGSDGAVTVTAAAATKSAGAKPAGTKAAGTSAASKGAPAAGGPKTSGPNYRPPTGTPRSAARRPPPPPKRKKRNITTKTIVAIVALPLIASLVIFFALAVNGSSSNTPAINATLSGPEQVPIPGGSVLASVVSSRYPQTIDGIKCEATEQVVYHIHAHLTVFVNGQPHVIPYGIGIAPPLAYQTNNGTFVSGGTCFYWLHTHAADGIIHIESPTQTTYNLGQFFDVWGQPLDSNQVGTDTGHVTVYVDGKPYVGDPRLIPLATHSQIQLDVGTPTPAPTNITWPSGL